MKSMMRVLAVALLVAGCGARVEPGTSTPTTPAGPSPTTTASPSPTPSPLYDYPNDAAVGQCFDPIRDKDDQLILAFRLKSCDEAHLGEISGKPELPLAADAPFPGDAFLSDAADKECRSTFTDYVGIDFDDSSLEGEFSYPSENTWPGGDRRVICMVVATDIAPLTRSVKGSRQ